MQMKRFVTSSLARCAWLSLAITMSTAALAGEVADLTTFMPGTPARASEVNGNFAALRTAVNDNHARLTAAETSAETQSTRLDALDASLQALQSAVTSQGAQIDSDLAAVRAEMRAPGVIAVSAQAFASLAGHPCTYEPQINVGHFVGGAATLCGAAAPVNLPHGAQITAVRCTASDSDDGKINAYYLSRQALDSADLSASWWSYWNSDAVESAPGFVVASLSTSEPALIDNSAYAYALTLYGHASSTPDTVRFYGCRVHYEYPE